MVGPTLGVHIGVHPEPKTAKNRLHLDLRVAAPGAQEERWARSREESERLTSLGGTVHEVFDGYHLVVANHEGNEFCIAARSP